MIYLDTSALVKLVVKEDETPELVSWLREHGGTRKGSSMLARVELPRAVRRGGDVAYLRAQLVLGDLLQLPMTAAVLDAAGSLPGPLRSLDAIHLASAMRVRAELQHLVAYDQRLLETARLAGLPIASPGAS
ncbi:type II toxin-antitoxin system VapC family toxin [Prauserella endophytica]|uniref:Type II toxin-antitoxin system VapC family toxin n=1 Tax=Prauserella endophytica TaxID=1592324 RepID=A0ABY2S7F4_9PSEU|nr:type II toxin-antitoxin system VapC family toxin [Prauserella endophytica]PXY26178.1 PIN domain-containing protein [Prauserella coralliicola]TKG71401.1 type II toxin-antitoxin system VapC family toxin [Prauserella endophytica]